LALVQFLQTGRLIRKVSAKFVKTTKVTVAAAVQIHKIEFLVSTNNPTV